MATDIAKLSKNVDQLNAKLSCLAATFFNQEKLTLENHEEIDIKKHAMLAKQFSDFAERQAIVTEAHMAKLQ